MPKGSGSRRGRVGGRSSRFGKVIKNIMRKILSPFKKPKGSSGKYGGKTSKRIARGGR